VTTQTPGRGSGKINFGKRFVDHVLAWGIKIRLYCGEAVPTTDGHHDAWVHLLNDEETLGEPAAEVVRAHFLEVLVASLVSCSIGSPSNHRADAWLLQIDEGVPRRDVMLVLEVLEIAFDTIGQKCITGLPTVPAGVLASVHT